MGTLSVSLIAITGPAYAAAVGYWHFDSGFTDSSGFGTNLSVPAGGVTIVPGGLIGGAASFNAGMLFSGNALLTASRTALTMAAFVKASGNPGPDAILMGNFFENPALVFRAGLTDHFGAVFGYIGNGGNNASAGAINDGQWHHVAMTFDGITIRTYIDGILGASQISSFSESGAVAEFSIGARSGPGNPSNPFAGLIDEAVFKADVLTSAQIRDLASVIINNGSSNTINDASRSELDVYVRNAACPAGWPSVDPVIDPEAACPSPGAATQLTLQPGGSVRLLKALDSSTISMSGGTVASALFACDSSIAAISGGTVSGLVASDSSTVTISGGTFSESLTARDSSSVSMSGGTVQSDLVLVNSATGSLSGGSVAGILLVQDSATLTWSGGTVGGPFIIAQNGGTIRIVGTGFARSGIPVPFGDLAIDNGTLTGTLISGEAINIVYGSALGTITLVNEDTDGDGMLNSFEVANGFDPLNADEDLDGIIDGQDDFDTDGLGNAAEADIGTNPNLADTDGDGLLDGQEIGTGVFGSEQVITTLADAPISVFGADVDGDGDIDALSASEFDDKIAWYENTDGLGTFGPQQVISTLADGANSVFAVDVDVDGDVDVLSASIVDDKIAWYENTDGLGTFGPQQVITTLADFASSVFGADLDGDGDTDVLSASGDDGKVAWYENTDGLGTFGPQQVIATLSTATSVFGTDVDRDGDIDVLAIGGSKVVWYENTDGLGSFGPEQIVSSLIAFGTSVHGADFDRDGNIDVLSASGASDTIAWYENTNGLGSFGPQQVITALTDGPQSVFGIDVDGDGDADVLSASGNDVKIAWYENTDGLGTFGPQKVIALLTDRPHAVFGADLDGDGDTDVLSAEVGTDTIAWFEQTNVSNPLVSDTDGDGLLDGFEVNNGFDPLVPGEQSLDPDGDGLDNLAEQAAGADPLSSDTDGDGLLDGAEVNLHGTDPTNADTDGDGVDDGVEVAAGTNPLDPLSFPGFVIDFDAGVGSPITYSEQGVTFTALNAAPSAHLHLGNNRGDPSPDLLNHSGCCSTPYEITSIGNFCLLSLEVVGGTNPGTFTSDTATAVVVPNTVGTFNFPVGFCGVTFTWEQAAGDLAIDDLRAIDFATPGVPALGPWGLAIVALLISGLGISTLSMRRRRSSG